MGKEPVGPEKGTHRYPETERKIAWFAKEMQERPLFSGFFADCRHFVRNAWKKPESGRNLPRKRAGGGGFLPYFHGECENKVRKMRDGTDRDGVKFMAFTVYLFGNMPFWEERAKRFCGGAGTAFCGCNRGRFRPVSEFGRLVRLRCDACGKEFHPSVCARFG